MLQYIIWKLGTNEFIYISLSEYTHGRFEPEYVRNIESFVFIQTYLYTSIWLLAKKNTGFFCKINLSL